MTSVLFVCLGNICRSPTAEGVFRARAHAAGLDVTIASAGTGAWHIGEPPDERAQGAALSRGYDLSGLRGAQVQADDFHTHDLILAMDEENLANLSALAPEGARAELRLFLDFAPGLAVREVPDPYYGGADGFDRVLDMIEAASDGLIDHIRSVARQP